jgi:hypothetical protein
VASDKEFEKIIAMLKRTMDLPLTQPQRGTLKELCQEIVGGSNEQGTQETIKFAADIARKIGAGSRA